MAVRKNLPDFIRLSEAFRTYAPLRLRKAEAAALAAPAPALVPPKPGDSIETVTALFEFVHQLSKTSLAKSEPVEQMKQELIRRLVRGELWARGVRTAPHVELEKRRIDCFIFEDAKIDWHKSKLSNLGQTFEGVEVRKGEDPTVSKRQEVESPNVIIIDTGRGRPSVSKEVDDVISQLALESKFLNLPRKSQEYEIRKLARAKYPTKFPERGNRPSKQTIINALKRAGILNN